MTLFVKIFSTLILPPGLFILMLLCIFVLLMKNKIKSVKILFLSAIILLYLISIEPVKDGVLRPLENKFIPIGADVYNFDLIIVLGGGVYEGYPNEEIDTSLSSESLKRILYAYGLYMYNKCPILVSGGIVLPANNSKPEAVEMKEMLNSMGIRSDVLMVESGSKDTLDNAILSKKLISGERYNKIALVTSAYHMPRSVMSFKQVGINVVPAPVDYQTDRAGYSITSFFPSIGSLEGFVKGLHEYIGILYYKVRFRFLKI